MFLKLKTPEHHPIPHLGLLLHFKFHSQSTHTPYHYFRNEWHSESIHDLYSQAQIYTLALNDLGVQEGERAAYILQPGFEEHSLKFASIALGVEILPLSAQEKPEDLFEKLEHYPASFLIIPDILFLEKIKHYLHSNITVHKSLKFITVLQPSISLTPYEQELKIPCLSLSALHQKGVQLVQKNQNYFEEKLKNLSPELPVFTFFKKKSALNEWQTVSFNHKNILTALENFHSIFKSLFKKKVARERLLSFLSPASLFGQMESFFPLIFNMEVFYPPYFEDSLYLTRKIKPTFLFMNPESLIKLLKKSALFGPHPIFGKKLRKIFILGSVISPFLHKTIEESKVECISSYLIFESASPVCARKITSMTYQENEGKPFGDVEIKTVQKKIYISSNALAFNSLLDREGTGFFEADEHGWMDSQGQLYLCSPEGTHLLTDEKLEQWMSTFPLVDKFKIIKSEVYSRLGVFYLNKEETILLAQKSGVIYSNFETLIKQPFIQNQIEDTLKVVNHYIQEPELRISHFTVSHLKHAPAPVHADLVAHF